MVEMLLGFLFPGFVPVLTSGVASCQQFSAARLRSGNTYTDPSLHGFIPPR